MVVVTGGMNQQRNQIVDAVVIARIHGAALLLVPVHPRRHSAGAALLQNNDIMLSNSDNHGSKLSSPFTRLHNRLYFARQASSAQGYFMREASTPNEKDNSIQPSDVGSADYIKEETPVVSRPPLFSRPATLGPYFAKPAQVEFKCSNDRIIEAPTRHESLPFSQSPNFARPRAITEENEFNSCTEKNSPSEIMGAEWLPRINVAESKSSHVITIELPCVDISEIRVEMDEKNITVKGKRSMKLSKAVRGFEKQMEKWMGACDCIITKAGPGTIAEAMIRGFPIILIDYIPGQEKGNVPYVVDNGAGVFTRSPNETARIVAGWFSTKSDDLKSMSENALRLAMPEAAFEIVRDMHELAAQRGPLAGLPYMLTSSFVQF